MINADAPDIQAALQEIEQLEFLRTNPVWFAETVLHITLDVWQREMLEALADVYRHKAGRPTMINHAGKNMITITAMHGPGKTFTAATAMHWFAAAFRGRIICTAPKEKQLTTRLWPAFRKAQAMASAEYRKPIDVKTTKITWFNDEDWCALAETASQPENLAGYHDDYMLIVVDEASGVNEGLFPVIEGMASTGTMVIVLLISNPTKNQGTFFASHNTPKVAQHYHQIHIDLAKTTRVDREWVQRMIDKYGENSPVVQIRCFGKFADSDQAQLIPYAWLTEAAERESQYDGSLGHLRITVDVADGGEDFTEVTAVRMYASGGVDVLEQREYSFPSAESPILSALAAVDMMHKHLDTAGGEECDFVVDSLGVGSGCAGKLLELGYSVVVYKGGEASDDTSQWRNRRSQSYIVLRDYHRDGKITYCEDFLHDSDWDTFAAQMCSIRTVPGSERLEEIETRESMKRRNLKSPDRADGIAMIFATQTPTLASTNLTIAVLGQSMAARGDW